MKTETQNLFRVAIVGAASLKGKELKDVLEERNFPAAEIKLLDDDESLGQLERVQDEVAVVQPVGRDELAQMDFTFFASEEDFTRKKWKLAREAGSAIVDMSYALENEPGVPVSAPWIERELGELTQFTLESSSIVMAHPAAVALALLLLRARKAGSVRNTIATIFEPVSERGRQGMDELHEQTVNLLSFQQLPTGVFDSQVAFNMLDRYGRASAQAAGSHGTPHCRAPAQAAGRSCADACHDAGTGAGFPRAYFFHLYRDGQPHGHWRFCSQPCR